MVTREELKQYRDMERELREKRALMRQAQLAARESERESDKKRAEDLARRYEKIAKKQEQYAVSIEQAIESLADPRHRRVLFCRYIQGWSRLKTSVSMGLSERTVAYLTKDAIKELEQK